jgi:hypothetical protein
MINRRAFTMLLGSSPLLAQAPAAAPPDLDWHDAKKFTVEGLGFKDLKSPYDRLPVRAENVVRKEVWNLSRDSSGVLVRFTAATKTIWARWTLTGKNLAGNNITAVASSGLDLYAKTDAGKWRWLGIGRPTQFPTNTEPLANAIPATPREFMIYLPLRNAVTSLEIGVAKDAAISPGPSRRNAKPIVFYGTSITHGISASRAGMTHVAMLGRIFDRETINLGFSGNGKMEPEVTKFIAELDPAVFVLDCLPNMNAKDVTERAESCVKILRDAHPQTPIMLVEDRSYPDGWLIAARKKHNDDNHEAMKAVYARMKEEKIPNLYYLEADNLLGQDGEGTVDGSHPTDLGFTRQAAEFERVLRKILG